MLTDRAHTSFVLVMIPERLVIEETARAAEMLADSGVNVGGVIVNDVPVAASGMLTPLVRRLRRIGIERVSIEHGVQAEEIGTFAGFVIAHTVLALPFVVTSVLPALTTFDRRLELASHSLGADRLTTFRRVTLPLIMPGIVSGAIFAFVTSFDEIVVAIFLSGPYMTTIPVRMFTAVSRELDPTISAVSTIILTLTTSLLFIVQFVRRPKEDEPRAA